MKLNFTRYVIFVIALLFNVRILSQPLASGQDKFLGNVHSGSSNIASYWDNYWNQVTPENATKWGSVEGSRDNFNWSGADNAYNYAKQRGIPFKWHTLIWGQQSPGWISALPPTEQLDEIVEWFSAVGQRYPEIDLIDVVNEALNGHNPPDGGGGRANFKAALGGNGTTGWDWVIKAFELARQYIPHAKLLINDYGIINDNNATTNYLTVINLLKNRGLIDGIGVQGHRFELMNASSSTLKSNMDRLWATGIPIYISELDLGPAENAQPDEALQLSAYQRIFPILWEHPGLKGITLWGYVQGQMWQPNCFLLRSNGTETPAMQWLRNYLSAGKTRTAKSGNWNDLSVWEIHNGTSWVAASSIPSVSDGSIIISENNTVTVTQSDSIDQLLVSKGGKLVINSGVTFTIKDGNGTDLTAYGTVENSGAISKDDSAEIKFISTGTYIHKQEGGSIPLALFANGSTVQFNSFQTTVPSNINQDFYNVVWNCPDQTSDLNLGWNGNTIGGNIDIKNTGTASLFLCGPEAGASATVTINGDIIQSGGSFSANGTGNGNTSITLNHNGNINVTGGNFSISKGNQGGTGTTVWNLNGDFTMSNATAQNSNEQGAEFVFTGTEAHSLNLGEGNTLAALPIEVDSGATLNIGTSVLEGTGGFILDAGGTIETSQPEGIDGNLKNTGTINLSSEGGYNYNGSSAQVTGSLLPDVVSNLIVNNSEGVALSKDVTVNGTMEIMKGTISKGVNNLIYGDEASLKYSDRSPLTTTDVEFPDTGGPKNLIIENRGRVTLHAARTIPGNVLVNGRFYLGDFDFTASSASNTGRTTFIVMDGSGSLRLTSVGQSESMFPISSGSSYAPVWVANSGDADIISVHLSDDDAAAPEGGRIKVKWDISEGTEGGGNYTLTFGWLTSLEDTPFRADRRNNAFIFNLTDTTEAGSGPYTRQFDDLPYTVSRGGITKLGPFGVGKFGDVAVNIEDKELLPAEYILSQNYPNPFNPTTKINYSVPQSGYITLKVYNLLGQKVKTLFEGFRQPGSYTVILNGNSLASGIYLYRLKAENYMATKKLVLLK